MEINFNATCFKISISIKARSSILQFLWLPFGVTMQLLPTHTGNNNAMALSPIQWIRKADQTALLSYPQKASQVIMIQSRLKKHPSKPKNS